MKKFNAVILIVLFVISIFAYGCSASAGVSIGKQSTNNTKIIK